jgi:hypothetical protein
LNIACRYGSHWFETEASKIRDVRDKSGLNNPTDSKFDHEIAEQMHALASHKVPLIGIEKSVPPPCLINEWSSWTKCLAHQVEVTEKGKARSRTLKGMLGCLRQRARDKVWDTAAILLLISLVVYSSHWLTV